MVVVVVMLRADYNEDQVLDAEDLEMVVDRLTGDQGLLPEEKNKLVERVSINRREKPN